MRPLDDPATLLRAHGLQVTAQRVAVLQAVRERPHCTALQAAADVRAQIGAVSQQAVYDALAALTGKGLVRRIQPAGSPALFDPRAGDDHGHVVCRSCLVVVDVAYAVGAEGWSSAAADSGFEIEDAEIVFWGTCPGCRAATTIANHWEPVRVSRRGSASSRCAGRRASQAKSLPKHHRA